MLNLDGVIDIKKIIDNSTDNINPDALTRILIAEGKTYENKEKLKKLGAKWHPQLKEWYFENEVDKSKLPAKVEVNEHVFIIQKTSPFVNARDLEEMAIEDMERFYKIESCYHISTLPFDAERIRRNKDIHLQYNDMLIYTSAYDEIKIRNKRINEEGLK